MSIPNLTDRNVSPKTTMHSNKPICSNALAIAAKRAKDVCDRVLSSQREQGIKKMSPDVMEIVGTLEALEGLNFWSLSVNFWSSQYGYSENLELSISSLLENLERCKSQLLLYGSVENFLTHAETLIDKNTKKAQ